MYCPLGLCPHPRITTRLQYGLAQTNTHIDLLRASNMYSPRTTAAKSSPVQAATLFHPQRTHEHACSQHGVRYGNTHNFHTTYTHCKSCFKKKTEREICTSSRSAGVSLAGLPYDERGLRVVFSECLPPLPLSLLLLADGNPITIQQH